jgi:DNA polymerase I-like protein with 3'-5' exonuclease and polymerase domains
MSFALDIHQTEETQVKVEFNEKCYEFRPWKPKVGRVFAKPFAFDCETTLIDEARPWITPAYVIGAAFDGKRGYFVRRDWAAQFFLAHADTPAVMHNAPFDLAVINVLAPKIGIYEKVDRNLVWDTQLLHRLYVLGTKGHTAGGKGESDLEHCAELYTSVRLLKDIKDSRGQLVRLSYGQWLNRAPGQIEPIYLEYLAQDAIATSLVFQELQQRLRNLLADSHKVWGFVSPEWLTEQMKKWGPQTHHIQLRGAIVLREITANGLHLDLARKAELAQGLETKLAQQRKLLRAHGYLPGGEGGNKSLQAVFKRLEAQYSQIRFPRTEQGLYATSFEALQDLAETVPFVKQLLEYRETEKLLGSFVGKMSKRVLHPSFNVLARSGRTTSFGEINAQNLPKDDSVRSCFVPSDGHVFIDADYSMIEMVTLAQACLGQFRIRSMMAEAINADKDLHRLVAARVLGKNEADVTPEERSKAKPINFGKPGGMGDATMCQYARVSYGVTLTDAEVAALSDAWFALFPEMRTFLTDTSDTPRELAKLLDLTPASHHEHTDDPRFLKHPENAGEEREPNRVLGCMMLKAVKVPVPETRQGRCYSACDIDYFWSRLAAKAHLLPTALQQDVLQRQPSTRLQREVMSLVGRAGVFTFTGRLRANASYTARHNTVFQGLAADGAKLALWLLWRAGYRIVNFVHDQVIIEVPITSDLKEHAEKISQLMVEGMRAVAPSMKVKVEYAATDRWHKGAKAVHDKSGKRLLLWRPRRSREKRKIAG